MYLTNGTPVLCIYWNTVCTWLTVHPYCIYCNTVCTWLTVHPYCIYWNTVCTWLTVHPYCIYWNTACTWLPSPVEQIFLPYLIRKLYRLVLCTHPHLNIIMYTVKSKVKEYILTWHADWLNFILHSWISNAY